MAKQTSQADTISVSRKRIIQLLDEVLELKKDNAEDKRLIIIVFRKRLIVKQ